MHKHKKPANRAVWTGSSLQDVDLEDFDSTAFALSVRSSARFILLQIGGGFGCILVPGRNRSTYHTHPQTISAGSLQFWSILYNCRESTGQVPASAINRTSWKGDVGSGVRPQRLMRSITIATQ